MKFKAKIKNNQLFVKVKISSSEVLSEREIDILSVKNIRGMLKPKQTRRNVIEYTGPAGIALCDYLKRTITKYEFFYFMAQIVEATKKVHINDLFLKNLILDMRYVYVNEITKEMQFIYIPIQSNHISLDVIGFMEAMLYSMQPAEDAAISVSKYSDFLKTQNGFEPEKIEKYISSEDADVAKQIKRHNLAQSGFITDKPRDYYEHYQQKNSEEATALLVEEEEATALLEKEEEATALLVEEEEATTLLNGNTVNPSPPHYASLERILTNEVVDINKTVFRLGTEKSCVDYLVTDNSAVSRSHADIITRENRYFVYDQGSTNHTYINEELVPVKLETEILDGNVLKLANEGFIFHI